MRHLGSLAALSVALVALLVPAALAAMPGHQPDKPAKAKPDKPGKPGKPAKPDKAEKAKGGSDVASAFPDHEPLPLPSAPPPVPPGPAHSQHTAFAETVAAGAAGGTVLVKLPGSRAITTLSSGVALPVGSTVDARAGLAEIGSETADGAEQHAVVTGAVFTIEQQAAAGGVTDLVLRGGDFRACDRKAGRTTARAAARKGTVVRGLWAAGKGKFRTRGRKSVASVRGTRWATVERCHSTTVRVFDGVVDVRDLLTGKTVTLRGGDRHVASALR